jgi:predicted small secreted protein
MKKLQKLTLSLFLVVAASSLFTGCRTAHGFGEDMEHAGQSIQDSTDK